MNNIKYISKLAFIIVTAIAVSSCGGGGGPTPAPKGPPVPISVAVQYGASTLDKTITTKAAPSDPGPITVKVSIITAEGKTSGTSLADSTLGAMKLGETHTFSKKIPYTAGNYTFNVSTDSSEELFCSISNNKTFSIDKKNGYTQKEPLVVSCNTAPPNPNPQILGGRGGWPLYLAMGSVTNGNTSIDISKETTNDYCSFGGSDITSEPILNRKCAPNCCPSGAPRHVNAIFQYEGTGQQGDEIFTFPIYTANTIQEAKDLTKVYQKSTNVFDLNTNVIPTMVVYTSNQSYGASTEDLTADNMKTHFKELILTAQRLQSNTVKVNGKDTPIGSVILNPDFLGITQKNTRVQALTNTINSAGLIKTLTSAVNEVEMVCTYKYSDIKTKPDKRQDCGNKKYSGNLNDLFDDLLKYCSYGNWNAHLDWATLVSSCNNPTQPKVQTAVPTFTEDLKGWIQATNWIMKNYAPDIPFGWQENVWSTNDDSWAYEANSAKAVSAATDIVKFLNDNAVFSGKYKPDFIVFDRYEFDDFNDAAYGAGYMYNANNWYNYLQFASSIGNQLKLPVMLWQIPGGGIQMTSGTDKREKNGGTAPNFFFGSQYGGEPIDYPKVKAYISKIPQEKWFDSKDIISYLQIPPAVEPETIYKWDKSYLQMAADKYIFAILWGGGNTTGVANIQHKDPTTGEMIPGDDGGWLANQIKNYLGKKDAPLPKPATPAANK